jgi:hypothetical protein
MPTCLEYLAALVANFMLIAEIVYLIAAVEDAFTEIPESLLFVVATHVASWLYLMLHTVPYETYEFVKGHFDLDYHTGRITETKDRTYTTTRNVPGWEYLYLHNHCSAVIFGFLLHFGMAASVFVVILVKN